MKKFLGIAVFALSLACFYLSFSATLQGRDYAQACFWLVLALSADRYYSGT